jgi:hypothetical protein
MVDALRFGSRARRTEWCVVVFRDSLTKENLWWGYSDDETKEIYQTGYTALVELGYNIVSVTADGFSGIRSVFKAIPFQMCNVHMKRLVIRGTTLNPQLEAGKVLLALITSLFTPKMTEALFRQRLLAYKDKYWDFLQEKSESRITGEVWRTHENLYQAFNSVYKFFPYLFTYTTNPLISRDTNSLEGHFSHVRDIVHIHRSLTRKRTEKVLDATLLCSTISPTLEQLKDLFE